MSTKVEEKDLEKTETNVETSNTDDTQQNVSKKRRRGISNDTRSTFSLKFSEKDAIGNLFKGYLANVELNWSTMKEDSAVASFRGHAVPRINLTFCSTHANESDRRFVFRSFNAVESTIETTLDGKKEWKVNNVFAWIKHIIDVYVLKGQPMPEELVNMLELPFEDFEEDMTGNIIYKEIDVEEVLKGWQILFENTIKFLNEGYNGKPVYKQADGKIIPIWMKLTRYTKRKNSNTKQMEWYPTSQGTQEGDLAFGDFMGEGYIELYNDKKEPNLKLDSSKESIVPQATSNRNVSPNMMPGMPGSPVFGNSMSSAPIGNQQAFNSAAEDLPF